MTFSNSEQQQSIGDNAQLLGDALVYSEKSHDGISTMKYDWSVQSTPWLSWTAGGRFSEDRLNYAVVQPMGLQNPYSSDPAPLNAMQTFAKFSVGSSAAYSQSVVLLPRGMRIVGGVRFEQW